MAKKKYNVESILEEVSSEDILQDGEVNLNSFILKDELCPEIWHEGKLDKRILSQLEKVANDFFEKLDLGDILPELSEEEIQTKLRDIYFIGSLASYNWSKYSDIDLHLVMDFTELADEHDMPLLKKYFTACKNEWNLAHPDLKVLGYEVEVYVQDINEENAANGIYSVMDDEWVKEPETMVEANLDKSLVLKKVKDIMVQVDMLERLVEGAQTKDSLALPSEFASSLWSKIVLSRRESLAAGLGEMNTDNIIFKCLRRLGYLEKLKKLKNKIYDLENSTERD